MWYLYEIEKEKKRLKGGNLSCRLPLHWTPEPEPTAPFQHDLVISQKDESSFGDNALIIIKMILI